MCSVACLIWVVLLTISRVGDVKGEGAGFGSFGRPVVVGKLPRLELLHCSELFPVLTVVTFPSVVCRGLCN